MSELQPSPDLQALRIAVHGELEQRALKNFAHSEGLAYVRLMLEAFEQLEPIITEWAKQRDEAITKYVAGRFALSRAAELEAELAALREENERLRADHERLLDKIKWLGHLGTISQEVAASLLGTVWVQP